MNSVLFVDPYDHINTIDNKNETKQFFNVNEENIIEEYHKEEIFDHAVDNKITKG